MGIKTDHELTEVFPGLVELNSNKDIKKDNMEEIRMSKEDCKEYLDSYMNDTLDLIPNEEKEYFKSSMDGMKDFLLHCENLHLYTNKDYLKCNSSGGNMPLIYGYRDKGSDCDALFMIRGGLIEECSKD